MTSIIFEVLPTLGALKLMICPSLQFPKSLGGSHRWEKQLLCMYPLAFVQYAINFTKITLGFHHGKPYQLGLKNNCSVFSNRE